ncbi:IclR family transcriptional regulator [Brucella cytisi]|uniref:IclR family transcriptional regulator n=1 Tax=Brucella cytisi TaxID=407152 RepID=A0A1J6HW17_9HYPH|nr:IclR family transcriptional regulator [Brucella cytisi]
MRSVARTVAVMMAFQNARQPLSLSQVANAAGIDRSAAQRIVHSLQKLDVIARDPADRGYLPGLRILDMTHDLLRLNPMLQRANPIMLELRRRVHERVDLSLFDDVRVVYAVRMPSKHEIFSATLVGHAVPTYCTAGGVAILSKMPDERIADIVGRSDLTPFTPHTIQSLEEVMGEVNATRERGHSVLCRQLLYNEVAIGAAILDAGGNPVGAIHVAGSLQEWTAESFSESFGPLVENAARTVSERR